MIRYAFLLRFNCFVEARLKEKSELTFLPVEETEIYMDCVVDQLYKAKGLQYWVVPSLKSFATENELRKYHEWAQRYYDEVLKSYELSRTENESSDWQNAVPAPKKE